MILFVQTENSLGWTSGRQGRLDAGDGSSTLFDALKK